MCSAHWASMAGSTRIGLGAPVLGLESGPGSMSAAQLAGVGRIAAGGVIDGPDIGGDVGDQGLDAGREGVDLVLTHVDLAEQHVRQFGVMLIEATVERGDQLRALGLHFPPGQLGQPVRVALPAIRASIMSHVDSVTIVEATAEILISASSSSFSSRCQ